MPTDAELTAFAEAMPGWWFYKSDAGDFFVRDDAPSFPLPADDDLPGQYAFVATVAQAKGYFPSIEPMADGELFEVTLWRLIEDPDGGPPEWDYDYRQEAPQPRDACIRAVLS